MGIWAARKVKNNHDFMLAGQRLGDVDRAGVDEVVALSADQHRVRESDHPCGLALRLQAVTDPGQEVLGQLADRLHVVMTINDEALWTTTTLAINDRVTGSHFERAGADSHALHQLFNRLGDRAHTGSSRGD